MDEQKKDNLITREIGNESLSFIIDKENYSELNVEHIQQYTPDIAALVNITTQVRQRSPFGDCDTIIENIKIDYANTFRPFDFQVENVKTMLKRFEGNGVFGDQVGLGKTVEALLSALVMFRCGAIKNALVVATSKTKDNWVNEAKRFSNAKGTSFEVINADHFEDVIKDIQEEYGKVQKPPYKIYVITDREWKTVNPHTVNYQNRASRVDKMGDNQEVGAEFEKMCDEIVGHLKSNYRTVGLRQVLEMYGWNLYSSFKTPTERAVILAKANLHKPNNAQYQCLLDKLNECIADLGKDWTNMPKTLEMRGFSNESITIWEKLDIIESFGSTIESFGSADWIGWFREAYSEIEDRKAEKLVELKKDKDDVFVKLFMQGENGDRAKFGVDLLIVDEIHQFFTDDEEEYEADGEEEYEADETDYHKMLLAQLPRRYCILISATPVRKSLKDIFYLTYIANPLRYGSNKKEALQYFYQTICRIPEGHGKDRRLSYMVRNEDARNGLVGMINSIFTRKRIHEISSQMKWKEGSKYYEFVSNPHGKKAIAEAFRILSLQNGFNCRDEEIYAELTALESEREDNGDIHFAAFDRGMMEIYDSHRASPNCNPDISVEQYHELIDWRRHDKAGCGIAVPSLDWAVIKNFKEQNKDVRGIENLCITELLIMKKMLELFDLQDRDTFWGNDKNFLNISVSSGKEAKKAEEKQNLRRALQMDAVVIYVSSVNLRIALKNCLCRLYENKRQVSIYNDENRSGGNTSSVITSKNYNRIILIDQGAQAGVNLQQYGTLIFAQMDSDKRHRIIDPLGVEQWIGRIYRTGQVRQSCHIITLVTDNLNNGLIKLKTETDFCIWKKEYDENQAFLQEYYNEYLSNPDALDLYGKGKPEIGFIQPIIADYIRYIYEQLVENRKYVERNKEEETCLDLQLRNNFKESDINKLNDKPLRKLDFAELIRLVFTTMKKNVMIIGSGDITAYEQFKERFKQLCHLKEFNGGAEDK